MTLQEMRKRNNMRQEDIAEKLGVLQSSVSQWEKGECAPKLDKIKRLAQLYGASTDDVISAITAAKEEASRSTNAA